MSSQYDAGLEVRREVLGSDYVEAALKRDSVFGSAFQDLVTEWCWGGVWTRPGLDRKTRSIINIAMLTALNKPAELKLHVNGALTNGVSVDEIKEILLQATIYCGVPAGLEAFSVADKAIRDRNAK